MEILIFISGGIAFGALLVVVWKNSVELREKSQRLAAAEMRLASVPGTGSEVAEITPAAATEKIAALERSVAQLNQERDRLLSQIAAARPGSGDDAKAAETASSAAEVEHRLEVSESENVRLKARIAELEQERNGHREAVSRLQMAESKTVELEDLVGKLQRERTEILDQLAGLEALRSRIPALEDTIARLNQENAALTQQISAFQSSIREKIKNQIDDLQELYQNLSTGVR